MVMAPIEHGILELLRNQYDISSESEDNMETDQKTDKVLVFIQICMGLIVILCIIFGGFVLWHQIKSHPNDPNVSEFTTTVAAIDLQVCTCTEVCCRYIIVS